VLVTHDPAVGAQAQRMIRMRDGSIVVDEVAAVVASES
jgi:predicted ABC-type transport system involved in lysophospholipase L1 biosynthesis ATPase subunit